MLRAYRLIYPDSRHVPPHLWECEQPYMALQTFYVKPLRSISRSL
jgi:hypothetical protein